MPVHSGIRHLSDMPLPTRGNNCSRIRNYAMILPGFTFDSLYLSYPVVKVSHTHNTATATLIEEPEDVADLPGTGRPSFVGDTI